jgi:hypothetical protein
LGILILPHFYPRRGELQCEAENSGELDDFFQDLYDTFGSAIDSIKTIQRFKILKRLGYPTQ